MFGFYFFFFQITQNSVVLGCGKNFERTNSSRSCRAILFSCFCSFQMTTARGAEYLDDSRKLKRRDISEVKKHEYEIQNIKPKLGKSKHSFFNLFSVTFNLFCSFCYIYIQGILNLMIIFHSSFS